VITTSLPKSFHESQYDGWSSCMQTICVDILKARWLRPAFAESYWLLRVTLSKDLVAVHVWNAPDQWHNWRLAGVRTPSPVKLNEKTGPLPSLYIGIYYSFGFSRLLFYAFLECFPVTSGFCTAVQYWICYSFSTIFWVLTSGLHSAKFPTGLNLWLRQCTCKVVLQIRAMCRASSSILQ